MAKQWIAVIVSAMRRNVDDSLRFTEVQHTIANGIGSSWRTSRTYAASLNCGRSGPLEVGVKSFTEMPNPKVIYFWAFVLFLVLGLVLAVTDFPGAPSPTSLISVVMGVTFLLIRELTKEQERLMAEAVKIKNLQDKADKEPEKIKPAWDLA